MAPVQSIWWKVRVEKEHWQQLIRGASTAEHWPEEANSVALGIQTQRNTEYKQKIYLGVALSTLLKKKEKKKYFITFEPLWEIKHNHHTPTHIWNVSTEAKVQFDHKKKRHCSSERQAACCVHAKSACNIKAKFKTWQAEAGKHRNIHSTRYQK